MIICVIMRDCDLFSCAKYDGQPACFVRCHLDLAHFKSRCDKRLNLTVVRPTAEESRGYFYLWPEDTVHAILKCGIPGDRSATRGGMSGGKRHAHRTLHIERVKSLADECGRHH